jgi:hypothetical protein
MSRRSALHDRYSRVARIGDASRLAYLHGPTTVWTEEEVAALWARGVQSTSTGSREPLNCLYIHVPFCKSICHFCNYDRLRPSSPELLKTWLARTLRTLDVIGPVLRRLTFHALYMGGGTPSVLPAPLLRELFEAPDATITWHPQASRKMEFDPAVMSRERLEVLAAGFDQLSRHRDPRPGSTPVTTRSAEFRRSAPFGDLRRRHLGRGAISWAEGTVARRDAAEMQTRRAHPRHTYAHAHAIVHRGTSADRGRGSGPICNPSSRPSQRRCPLSPNAPATWCGWGKGTT